MDSESGRPTLLVGIDTEGDNQWDVRARRHPTFENIRALPRLHALFTRYGVRPTYVITYPVATNPGAAGLLRDLQATGTCEIGAHHHAWETPPCPPDGVERHPYASALPLPQFEAQVARLTAAIAQAMERQPVSYRSGRFGLSADHVVALERAGYQVESSVAPLLFEAHKGGPDFVDAPLRPYFLSYDDPSQPGTSRLLEVPISAGLNRRLPRWLIRLYGRAPRPYATRRVLRALGLARMIWLRPSYSSLADMQAFARRLAAAGQPVLNLVFHSSEAIAGGSPYNRTAAELERFFERLERFLLFAVQDLNARPSTFAEFRGRFLESECGTRSGA